MACTDARTHTKPTQEQKINKKINKTNKQKLAKLVIMERGDDPLKEFDVRGRLEYYRYR